jgi:hypothetical protein
MMSSQFAEMFQGPIRAAVIDQKQSHPRIGSLEETGEGVAVKPSGLVEAWDDHHDPDQVITEDRQLILLKLHICKSYIQIS